MNKSRLPLLNYAINSNVTYFFNLSNKNNICVIIWITTQTLFSLNFFSVHFCQWKERTVTRTVLYLTCVIGCRSFFEFDFQCDIQMYIFVNNRSIQIGVEHYFNETDKRFILLSSEPKTSFTQLNKKKIFSSKLEWKKRKISFWHLTQYIFEKKVSMHVYLLPWHFMLPSCPAGCSYSFIAFSVTGSSRRRRLSFAHIGFSHRRRLGGTLKKIELKITRKNHFYFVV